jgi:hypothetical protein
MLRPITAEGDANVWNGDKQGVPTKPDWVKRQTVSPSQIDRDVYVAQSPSDRTTYLVDHGNKRGIRGETWETCQIKSSGPNIHHMSDDGLKALPSGPDVDVVVAAGNGGVVKKPPPPPPPPSSCRPAEIIIVKQGSINSRVNVGVTVRNTSTGATKNNFVGVATIFELASAIQRTAAEVGLSAAMLGGDAVRVCGLNNTFSVTNGVLDYRKEN